MTTKLLITCGTIATALTANAATTLFTEDFSTHANWATEAGGTLPAVNTSTEIGAGIGTPNGWAFQSGNSFNDSIALTNGGHGTGTDDNWEFATGTGVGLSLKNWTSVSREVSLTGVVNDQATLSFDFWMSADQNGTSTPNNFSYAVLDAAPGARGNEDWGVAGDTDIAYSASNSGHIDLVVDTSSFTGGSFFIAFNDNGWNSATKIDNVMVTSVPEPSSAALLGLGGLALILRRRK